MKSEENPKVISGNDDIVFPPALVKGDRIALISPASAVREEYVSGAMERLRERGYEPVLMPHALGPSRGSFAASEEFRLQDLLDALEDNRIKAILCTRGGYGCSVLLDRIPYEAIASDPKWIIGYSDVSALHAKWNVAGVASVHGPMAKHLALEDPRQTATEALFNILETGGKFDYLVSSSGFNLPGRASGILRGGNLAVLNDLAATPYDILRCDAPGEDVILFFEDISEPIYAIERMLVRLCLSGAFENVKGLIFGQFTEYKPDKNFQTAEEMISALLHRFMIRDIPVALNFPVGHVSMNFPLVEGAVVELAVDEGYTHLFTT